MIEIIKIEIVCLFMFLGIKYVETQNINICHIFLVCSMKKLKCTKEECMGSLMNLNDKTFNCEISKLENMIILDFGADWCGPCKILSPILEELSNETKTRIYKVNVDNNPILASQFEIKSIPTIIILKEGKKIRQLDGIMSKDQLREIISTYKENNTV
jgi:thioredoxin 1